MVILNKDAKKEFAEMLYAVIFNESDLSRCSEFIKDDIFSVTKPFAMALLVLFINLKNISNNSRDFIQKLSILLLPMLNWCAGEKGAAVVDIYRFEDNKIAERLDVLQKIPGQSVNDNGMFPSFIYPIMLKTS